MLTLLVGYSTDMYPEAYHGVVVTPPSISYHVKRKDKITVRLVHWLCLASGEGHAQEKVFMSKCKHATYLGTIVFLFQRYKKKSCQSCPRGR